MYVAPKEKFLDLDPRVLFQLGQKSESELIKIVEDEKLQEIEDIMT